MSAQLKSRGYRVGRRKARRYMNEMDIYPKMNLSKRMQQAKVCPYLLRNVVIDAPNQAWSIDITYIPIKRGFLYLTAVIDCYSRCIVSWEVNDTFDTRMVINAWERAFKIAKPPILNSDQGCQCAIVAVLLSINILAADIISDSSLCGSVFQCVFNYCLPKPHILCYCIHGEYSVPALRFCLDNLTLSQVRSIFAFYFYFLSRIIVTPTFVNRSVFYHY